MSIERMLTSAEKAQEMGVGVSSVKRWADEGKLEFIVTPGGHRRFRSEKGPRPPSDARATRPPDRIAALLKISDRLHEIGEQWACGEITVADEHRESHAIAESLDRMRVPNENGPLCILACPPDELHELPLRMVRLVLEWRGWRTDFLGASTPWDALQDAVKTTKADLVALSARQPFVIPVKLAAQVVVGGSWARGPAKGPLRFRSVRAFDRWLASHRPVSS
jgi:excisionase family DNA binding protein